MNPSSPEPSGKTSPAREETPINALDPDQLRAALEELRAKMRALELRHAEAWRQFTYSLAHDLREPVRMISSYGQLLERRYEGQLDQDGREFMGYVSDAVQRIDRLLGDLLAYSRHLGIPDEPPSPVDAELALHEAVLNMEATIRESGAHITHDALPSVLFDFGRLTYLFQQLISNSIKFRAAEAPRIHISACPTGDEIIFAVRDNGLGVDPRYHEQIFGIFKRLHGRQYSGTGMGLAICKRIVEQYGGRVWVESEAGQGATFRFTLPK